MMTDILHAQLSYAVIGAAMDVHNELGPGWDEEAYHCAMLQALEERGVKAESKLRGRLMHRDVIADRFELDILVEDQIILELKHIVAPFAPSHYCQLISYLKFWKKDLGILINFGLERLRYERVPYSPVDGTLLYDDPKNKLQANNTKTTTSVLSALNAILEIHGLGYGTKTYQRIFDAECRFQSIECETPFTCLSYKEHSLGEKRVDAFLINKEVLVLITALGGRSTATDLAHLLAYMKTMEMGSGILANFGKSTLTLRHLTL